MYDRLLNLASGTLAEKEFKQEKSNFWDEPYRQACVWKPCVDRRTSNLGEDMVARVGDFGITKLLGEEVL
ncbi:hypothetical protein Q3G72_029004 [Acer saccharum]|nr:hypothetical protein Q3G72_029004 [Acer saccharum]